LIGANAAYNGRQMEDDLRPELREQRIYLIGVT
jgi:hypothetical protein